MSPSLRRRGQAPSAPHFPAQLVSDTDEAEDVEDIIEEEEEEIEEVEQIDDTEEEEVEDEDIVVDGEDDGDEDEEPLASPAHSVHAPVPQHFREISTLASWTVSSSKPGCSIPQLRNPSTEFFWQSDGPQPHYLNIHFFKLVRIVGLRLFLDFDADESYTPTRIVFLAGSGNNDLVEWGEMKLEQPRGWIWADFAGVGDAESGSEDEEDDDSSEGAERAEVPAAATVNEARDDDSDFENTQPTNGVAAAATNGGIETMNVDAQNQLTPNPQLHQHSTPTAPNQAIPRIHPRRPFTNLTPNASPHLATPAKVKKQKMPVLRAHLVQIKILENHQNGKDTHLRGLQIFAKDTGFEKAPRHGIQQSASGLGITSAQRQGMKINGIGSGMRGLSRSPWDVEPTIR